MTTAALSVTSLGVFNTANEMFNNAMKGSEKKSIAAATIQNQAYDNFINYYSQVDMKGQNFHEELALTA